MANNQGIVVKAYLDSQEIRRFLLDTSVCTNFDYVAQKAKHIFQISPQEEIRFSWKDDDGDMISFSSNEELVEALNQVKDNIFRIYLSRLGGILSSESSVIHAGVICDGCQSELRGTRYKCTVCLDYDLCSRCEFEGKHNQHDMMCVRRPIPSGDWVFWHNFANTSSQQRGMDYQGSQGPPNHPFWRCRNKFWKKAWRCHQKFQRGESPREVAEAKSKGEKPHRGPEVEQPCPLAASEAAEKQREFLQSMSEAVQSMLNPFGIDVSFSLPEETKEGEPKDSGEVATKEKSPESLPTSPSSPSERSGEAKKGQAMNVDLDSIPGTPDPQRTAEFIVIDPDDEEAIPHPAPAPKVAVSLELMKRMGFNDTGGWLTALLSENDGDIGRVLDVIQRRYHQE